MDILKRIFSRIKKSQQDITFNLKRRKFAEDFSSYDQEAIDFYKQNPQVAPAGFSDWLVNQYNKVPGGYSPSSTISPFVQTDNSQSSFEQEVNKFIAKSQQNHFIDVVPSEFLTDQVTKDANKWAFLRDAISNAIGVSPENSNNFIQRMIDETRKSMGSNEEGQESKKSGNPFVNEFYKSDGYWKALAILSLKYYPKETDIKNNIYSSSASIKLDLMVEESFRPITDSSSSYDQRMNFFLQYPEEIPDELFTPENIKSLENKFGISVPMSQNEVNADIARQMMKGYADKRNMTIWMSEHMTDLLDILMQKIEGNDKKIVDWVTRASSRRGQEKDRPAQIGGNKKDDDDSRGSLYDNTIPVSQLEKVTPETTETNEDYLNRRRSAFEEMTALFSDIYLQEVMSQASRIGEDVFRELIRESEDQGKLDDKVKYSDMADRVLIALNVAQEGVDNFFKPKDGSNPLIDTNSSEDYITFLSNGKKAGIPKNALAELFKRIEFETGQDPKELFNEGKPSAQAVDIIKNYAKESAAKWSPDWEQWVGAGEIRDRFREIGAIKYKIKQFDPQIPSEEIYDNLSPEEKSLLDKQYKSPEMVYNFIDRTKIQPLRAKISSKKDKRSEGPQFENNNSVERNWLYVGMPEKGGIKNTKGQFLYDAKSIIPLLKGVKETGRYGADAFKAFFNIIPPHGDIIKGGKTGNKTRGFDFGGKSLSEGYHDLVGSTEEDMPPLLRHMNEVRKHNKDKALEEIEKSNLSRADKKLRETDLNKRWDNLQKAIDFYQDIAGKTGKKAKINKIKKTINDQNKRIDRLYKKMQKLIDATGNPTKQEEIRKEYKSKIDPLEKKLEHLERELYKKEQELKNIINQMRSISDLYNLPRIANSNQFMMIFSEFQADRLKMNHLFKMASEYKRVKMASCANSIESQIESIISKYETLLS